MLMFMMSIFSLIPFFLSPDGDGGGGGEGESGEGGESGGSGEGEGDSGKSGEGEESGEEEEKTDQEFKLTKSQLEKRLDRASKSAAKKLAKDFGFDNVADFREAVKSGLNAAKEAKEKADKEKPEIERLKNRLTELEEAGKKTTSENAKLKQAIAIRKAVDKAGVNDADIAEALYLKHVSDEGDDAKEPDEFFESLKEAKPALFGEVKKESKTSTGPPPTDSKPDGKDKKIDALKMSPEEWKKYKREIGY